MKPWILLAAFLGIVFLCGGCRIKNGGHPFAPMLAGDSVELISVHQTDGNVIKSGQAAHFIVRLAYSLESRPDAVLALSLDKSQRPESCVPDANAASLEVADTERVAITHGMHTVDIPVTWRGSSRPGAVTLEASIWSKQPSYKFLTRWFGTQFCQRL